MTESNVALGHISGRYMKASDFKLFAESCVEAGVAKDVIGEMDTYITKHADKDGDGKIDKTEFAQFLRKNDKFGIKELEAIEAVMRIPHDGVNFQETKVGVFEYDKYGNLIAQHKNFNNMGGYGGEGYGESFGHSFKCHTVAADSKGKVRRPLVVIAGPPAGGKGTLCKKIACKYNFKHISTGAMLREKAKTDEYLAERMSKGALIRDADVFMMLIQEIVKVQAGTPVLLDGFPRNKAQADMLREYNFLISHFLLLDVNDDECKKRVLNRAKTALSEGKTPRKDDTSEVILNRLKIYHDTIASFAACYKSVTIKIDGNGTPDEVWRNCNKSLSSLYDAKEEKIEVTRKISGVISSRRVSKKENKAKKKSSKSVCAVQ